MSATPTTVRARNASPSQAAVAQAQKGYSPTAVSRRAAPPPTSRTPLLRPLASLLLLTVVVGSAVSVYVTSADLTTFRSRIPASQLNRWEMGQKIVGSAERAFPVPTLPYFADKRNVLNQLFVKQAWAWTTAAFFFHSLISFLLHPKPTTAQRISLNGPTPFSTLLATIRRYLLATLYWYYLTQSTWFGVSYPSISRQILLHTGAMCVPSALGSSDAFVGLQDGAGGAGAYCTGAKGEYWKGGHDVSGHTFMMVHSTLFLYHLIAPSLPLVFPSWFRSTPHPNSPESAPTYEVKDVEAPGLIQFTVWATIALMAIWWWMLLMTSLFFHSPAEKLTGFMFALGGAFISGL